MARLCLVVGAILAIAVCGVALETSTQEPVEQHSAEPLSTHPSCEPDTHFQCDDFFGTCIPIDRVCDGQWDCPSGDDEANCPEDPEHNWMPSEVEFDEEGWLICAGRFQCAEDSKCVDKAMLCDGRKDCADGSDEGAWCDACQDADCSHQCENTPEGPLCSCPTNMRLSVDDRTCEFESHCSAQSKCSHSCIDSIDRLMCVCASGYDLQADGLTCAANATYQHGRLFFSKDGHSIQVAELFPADDNETDVVEDLLAVTLPPAERITSMAYANGIDRLYYAVDSAPRLSAIVDISVRNATGEPRTLFHGHGIKHIAVDWAVGNIYYAADGIGIGVCSMCGTYCHHLITVLRYEKGELAQHYNGLIVHPNRGLLIWSEIDSFHPTGIVMAAGLDGTNRRAIGHLPTAKLVSISIDYVRDELITLEVDGLSTATDLNTLEKRPRGALSEGFDPRQGTMIHFNGQHYYRRIDGLVKQTKANTSDLHVISPLLGHQGALAIDNELYYARHGPNNPCCAKKCTHLCVLKDGGTEAECLCPDKYLRDELSGACSYNQSHGDGPVHAALSRVEAICQSGGLAVDVDNGKTSGCKCPVGRSGLYCELGGSADAVIRSGSSTTLITLGTIVVVMGIAGAGYLAWKKLRGLNRSSNDIGMGEFSSGHGRQALLGRTDSCTYDVRSTYSNGHSSPTRPSQPPLIGGRVPPPPRTNSLALKEEIRKAYETECAQKI